jgi:UDP-2,3-diacylglucosamine pyrophosphatase LpxH
MKIIEKEDGSKIHKKWAVCISDIHLFSIANSDKEDKHYITGLRRILSKRDVVVLNGDVFELEYCKYGREENINKSIALLNDLISEFPEKTIIYVPGNHDCRRIFWEKVEALADKNHNFIAAQHGQDIGSFKFTHGDREIRKFHPLHKKSFYPNGKQFYERPLIDDNKSDTKKKITAAIYNHLETLVFPIHNLLFLKPNIVSNKILGAYKHALDRLENIDTIITSHTHLPFNDYRVQKFGKEFSVYNTGSPRKSSKYNPLKFIIETNVDKDGNITEEKAYITEKQKERFGEKAREMMEEYKRRTWVGRIIHGAYNDDYHEHHAGSGRG